MWGWMRVTSIYATTYTCFNCYYYTIYERMMKAKRFLFIYIVCVNLHSVSRISMWASKKIEAFMWKETKTEAKRTLGICEQVDFLMATRTQTHRVG